MAIAALLLAFALPIAAQTRDVILWLPTVAPDADVEASLLETTLGEILASATDARHIVGRSGLRRALENGEFTLPPCFAGAEPCMSAEHAVLQTLGIDLVIRLVAEAEGEIIELTVLDGALAPRSNLRIEENDLRLAAFAAVASATGASARLSVSSAPVQATVLVDGEPMGATPFQATLPVGLYRVTLTAEGYFDNTTNLELRAGETRALAIDMSRRFALLTLTSGTPGAELFVDDNPTPHPVNAPITLEPGDYQIEVRSAEYTPQSRQITLVAGEDRSVSMNLLLSPETIRRRERELVLAAPLMLQLGVHLDGSSMSLDGAHGNAFGSDITLLCPAGDDPGPVAPGAETATPCAGNSGVFSPAVEGDVIYAWRFFEVGVVGFGYRMIPLSRDGRTHVDRSDTRFVDIESGRAFTLRFPSVGVRWLFGPSIEPFFRTGPTLEFERFRGVESGATISPDEVTLRRNSVYWEARAGVRVHANRLIYGWVDGHVAGNLSHNDGTRGGATLGVGINLPDLFGFDDMLNERFPRRGPRSERDTSTTPQPGDSLPEQL